ncbi:putative tail protein [Bajunvirus bajun]|uniref:Tail protein n=1 Tax=Brevundimonas phage vB_BgoS-Bajun TaxID=2948594 RepID=A0A9E7N533_9CAUD|nr:putative tail protein [Brevundimonas phage vB_BgoS-Bajun]
MADTPILKLPQVAPGQNQKELTINTALAILEAAMNDSLVHTGKTANFTLNEDQWTRYFLHRVSGNTTAITMTVPARERLFVVSNEGTAALTITPAGGSAGNSAEVPFGKIVLLVNDGVNIYAISSGVGRLQDLSDVDGTGAVDGMILSYESTGEKWVPVTVANLFNLAFTGLSDTPNNYTGAAKKFVRVNAAANALEFFVPSLTSLSDVNETLAPDDGEVLTFLDGKWISAPVGAATIKFTDLNDAPDSFTGQGGKAVVVKESEDGVEFVEVGGKITVQNEGTEIAAEAAVVDFVGTGVNATFAGGKVTVTVNPTALTAAPDVPDALTGQAGKALIVKDTEDGFEFGDTAGTFLALTDTPAAYTGQAGKAAVVNDAETGLEFGDIAGVIAVQEEDALVQAAVTTLNFEGDGVSVSDDGAGKVTITVGPGGAGVGPFGEHAYWRVFCTSSHGNNWFSTKELDFYSEPGGAVLNTGGTPVEGGHYSAQVAANAFDNDTATEWTAPTNGTNTGTAWIGYHFAAPVSVVEVKLQASNSPTTESFKTGSVQYSDNGVDWTEAWDVADQPNWTTNEIRTFNYLSAPTGFVSLGDTPTSYLGQADKKVRVKTAESGLEFVADTFLSQIDTPSTYSGQGGKTVRVNSAASGLEFVLDTQAANVVSSKTAAYTPVLADAQERTGVIPVNVASTVDVTIPTNTAVPYPVGTQISILQIGAAKVGIVGAAGVTVNKPAAFNAKTREQNSLVMALKIATDTWVLLGDMEVAP